MKRFLLPLAAVAGQTVLVPQTLSCLHAHAKRRSRPFRPAVPGQDRMERGPFPVAPRLAQAALPHPPRPATLWKNHHDQTVFQHVVAPTVLN